MISPRYPNLSTGRLSRGGGTGRRTRLKIVRDFPMRVRFPPAAPKPAVSRSGAAGFGFIGRESVGQQQSGSALPHQKTSSLFLIRCWPVNPNQFFKYYSINFRMATIATACITKPIFNGMSVRNKLRIKNTWLCMCNRLNRSSCRPVQRRPLG